MTTAVFADTWYWAALLNFRDQHHGEAVRLQHAIGDRVIVTTDEVLVELLAFYSERGAPWRDRAARFVRLMLSNDNVEVRAQTRQSFLNGLDLYERRPDKGYSLTDCISMQTMAGLGIREVLTGDSHFRQEGLLVL